MTPEELALAAQLIALATQGISQLIKARQDAETNQQQSMDENYTEAMGHFQSVVKHAGDLLAALPPTTPAPVVPVVE